MKTGILLLTWAALACAGTVSGQNAAIGNTACADTIKASGRYPDRDVQLVNPTRPASPLTVTGTDPVANFFVKPRYVRTDDSSPACEADTVAALAPVDFWNDFLLLRPDRYYPGREYGASIRTVWDRLDLLHSPGRDVLYMANVSPNTLVYNNNIYMMGSPYPASLYVDDVKTRGTGGIPLQAVDQVQMTANGIPACWGDSYSGFVHVYTRSTLGR